MPAMDHRVQKRSMPDGPDRRFTASRRFSVSPVSTVRAASPFHRFVQFAHRRPFVRRRCFRRTTKEIRLT
jgi:hypothetical protein